MPLNVLPLGIPVTLLTGIIYALPAGRCMIFTSATTPVIQQSTDVAFGTNVAITFTNGQAELAGGFIKSTAADIPVIVKRS